MNLLKIVVLKLARIARLPSKLAASVAFAVMLSACGQRGPLVLPKPPEALPKPAKSPQPSTSTLPSSQNK